MYSIKGDYNVSEKLRLNALFSRQYFNSYTLVGPIPGALAEAFQEFGDSKYYRLNTDYVIKPNVLNHFTFGHNQRDLGEGPNLGLDDAFRKAIPMRRFAQPSEVADAIVFLASGRSDYITGQVLSVSGGLTMVG